VGELGRVSRNGVKQKEEGNRKKCNEEIIAIMENKLIE